jgi:putative acetyltransferase
VKTRADTVSDCSRQGIRIREFQPRDKEAFRRLNEQWITRYFQIEEKDRQLFGDPEEHILSAGGAIFIAELDGEPVGCCALVSNDAETFEVAKMAVTESQQGRGLGRMLLLACIKRAKLLGKKRLFIETNRSLQAAIALYRKLGFIDLPAGVVPPSQYVRGDVFLELEL